MAAQGGPAVAGSANVSAGGNGAAGASGAGIAAGNVANVGAAGGGGGGLGRVRLNWYTSAFSAPTFQTSGVKTTGAVLPQ